MNSELSPTKWGRKKRQCFAFTEKWREKHRRSIWKKKKNMDYKETTANNANNKKETWSFIEVILLANVWNTMDRTCEPWEIFKKNRKRQCTVDLSQFLYTPTQTRIEMQLGVICLVDENLRDLLYVYNCLPNCCLCRNGSRILSKMMINILTGSWGVYNLCVAIFI